MGSAFGTLREDREFADVTLACEDGQQVAAHKVILASASPFFLDLLKRNTHPHPLIYMRGIKPEDLMAIVDFLYCGEANVSQDNLENFLAVAEELKLKGLSGKKHTEEETAAPTIHKMKPKHFPKSEPEKILRTEQSEMASLSESSTNQDESMEGTVAVTDDTVAADLQDLEGQINSMMDMGETFMAGNHKRVARICTVCGKQGADTDIKRHIESKHITGVSHTCTICGKVARSTNGLRLHMSAYHKNTIKTC